MDMSTDKERKKRDLSWDKFEMSFWYETRPQS